MRNRVIVLTCCLMLLCTATLKAQVGPKDVPNKPPPKIKLLPDLVIEEVQVINPEIGKIKVRVRNKGNKVAPPCQTFLVLQTKDGEWHGYSQMLQPSLGINAFTWLTIQTGYSVIGRDFAVETDKLRQVEEWNEQNNVWNGNMGSRTQIH